MTDVAECPFLSASALIEKEIELNEIFRKSKRVGVKQILAKFILL